MSAVTAIPDNGRYARCIDISKRVRWDIDRDVIRGRVFDFEQKFLPDGLSSAHRLDFLSREERRLLSQVQGRTYANLFGIIERYINAKILEVSRDHWFGDQVALEALIRFSDEELKHQELFRRLETMFEESMPPGYRSVVDPNELAKNVMARSTWAVMALTCHVEIFTQVHYKKSIEPDAELSPLWKDVFLHHWKEESQHAVIDELEWRRIDRDLDERARDQAVADLIDLIDLVVDVDRVLQAQSAADAEYFIASMSRRLSERQVEAVRDGMLAAYRWQYIVSGIRDGRFLGVLADLTNDEQIGRVSEALGPLLDAA